MSVPYLQDPIRMHVYEWVLGKLGEKRGSLLDIGCRDSGFPSYMQSLGFAVTACERDPAFKKHQDGWMAKYGKFNLVMDDLRTMEGKFDTITSIFALQHNSDGDSDIVCYEKCAYLLNPGGRIFVAHEYNKHKAWIQEGRDDGALRGYDNLDLMHRLIHPVEGVLIERKMLPSWDVKYMRWDGLNAKWCDEEEAMTACIEIKSL